MTHDVTLPFSKETCELIGKLSLDITMYSAPLIAIGSLILLIKAAYAYHDIEIITAACGWLWGLGWSVWLCIKKDNAVISLYNKHKIQFKCKCDKDV